MVVQEMTERECRELLTRAEIVRLACAQNNQPYVVPIRVDAAPPFLYAYATLGQKIEWMRLNPLVCVEIDEISSRREWATLIVFGHYEELPNAPGYEDQRRAAERLFQRHAMWWEPASVPLAADEQRPPVVFRIRIDRMTGRRTALDTMKSGGDPAKPPNRSRARRIGQALRSLAGQR